MSYGIWLSWNNQKEGFDLPVLPAEIGVSVSGDGGEHEVQGGGKINVIKNRGLKEYSIESFFPRKPSLFIPIVQPYVKTEFLLSPKRYVESIMRWWESRWPIRFVYVGSTMQINTPVSIESFEWRESGGTPGDIEYKLKLKEYRFYSAQQVKVENNTVKKSAEKRVDDRVPASTYTVVSGDSLWKIAQRALGDGGRWREIQALNGITDAQTKSLKIGTILKLPAVKANA
ncbi:LysM peptidoglycan-binding domain-containing protein [Paenibacillus sp. PR3]|uniref:LysM peptidoglycan-binding domain-containing protein n=1 Tax=Paenibacillus terricola TaxID=2763503 RepID=A0ABR8MNP9_9BACL|nr:LysM peptidoglycan-binding domain-containing protein [Paenibacillus terricola]MBD3917634.1 LysM peptidoglycan-binding domain-containing protein [Paenibacillus terricola]